MALQETKKKEVNTSCGYTKACRPKWLQAFSNAKAFLVVMTACTITQGFAINGINNSNTVMYERRYELSSRVTSLVTVFEDLAGALVVILVGYNGSTRHKPRLMA
ncbi:solute carrier organic anion transporter family member 4A1-like, partial [Watersipora subatra]|uniref:solute carrier organic anion transporter family member 4A1-like n=1 Tax=Watersipora subatra TaxID=2589382 RepID=UPI00355BFC1C